jgi:Zn-dependent protease
MVVYKIFYYWAPENTATVFLAQFFVYMISMNVGLAVFNLIPVPPLDGSRVALVLLPQRAYFKVMQYERVIMVILLACVWFGLLDAPLSYLNHVMWQVLNTGTGYVDRIAYSIYYARLGLGV